MHGSKAPLLGDLDYCTGSFWKQVWGWAQISIWDMEFPWESCFTREHQRTSPHFSSLSIQKDWSRNFIYNIQWLLLYPIPPSLHQKLLLGPGLLLLRSLLPHWRSSYQHCPNQVTQQGLFLPGICFLSNQVPRQILLDKAYLCLGLKQPGQTHWEWHASTTTVIFWLHNDRACHSLT